MSATAEIPFFLVVAMVEIRKKRWSLWLKFLIKVVAMAENNVKRSQKIITVCDAPRGNYPQGLVSDLPVHRSPGRNFSHSNHLFLGISAIATTFFRDFSYSNHLF